MSAWTEPTDDGRSPYQRMVAGDWYRPFGEHGGDEELAARTAAAREKVARYNALPFDDVAARTSLLEDLFGAFGEGTVVTQPFQCEYGDHLRLGSFTFVNFGLVALDCAPITIGDHVQIGPNVQLLTPVHPTEPEPRRAGWEAAQPIVIEDNVWLGGGVIVLPGVTIGADTVVGAGAVVTRDLPAGVLALGNPARVVRSLR